MKRIYTFLLLVVFTFSSNAQGWSFADGQYGTTITGNVSTSNATATHGTASGVFILNGTGEANAENKYYVMGEYRKSFSYSTGNFLMADIKLKNVSGASEVRVSMYGKMGDQYVLLESYAVSSVWHTFSGVVSSSEFISEILFIIQTTSSSASNVSAEVYIDNVRMQFGTGSSPSFEIWDSFGDSLTGVDDENVLHEFTLHQNYPNPFNPSTTISYEIPRSSNVTVSIYNILGQKMYDLVDMYQTSGTYSITFDAADISSGIYIYTLKAGDMVASRRMLLVK